MTENVARISSALAPVAPSKAAEASLEVKPVNASAAAPTADEAPQTPNSLADAGRYRLTIEAVGRHRFVYKVLDRVTGEVIRQLPREEVEKLISDPTYRGGQVVDTAV